MSRSVVDGIELTREQEEKRRLLAMQDLDNGMKQSEIARKYHVRDSSVSRWAKAYREKGKEGIKSTFATGRPQKLNVSDKEKLISILLHGAIASGYETDSWTGKIVSDVIKKEFNVDYHFKHIPKLLRSLGFRQVKPKRKAMEQNDDARKEWIKTTWEYVKKN